MVQAADTVEAWRPDQAPERPTAAEVFEETPLRGWQQQHEVVER
jgi:hypothetical protein